MKPHTSLTSLSAESSAAGPRVTRSSIPKGPHRRRRLGKVWAQRGFFFYIFSDCLLEISGPVFDSSSSMESVQPHHSFLFYNTHDVVVVVVCCFFLFLLLLFFSFCCCVVVVAFAAVANAVVMVGQEKRG